LTLYFDTPLQEWTAGVLDLLSESPLQAINIYCSGDFMVTSPETDVFWVTLLTRHISIKRFSVHRMLTSMNVIDFICSNNLALEELFVVVPQSALVCGDNLLSIRHAQLFFTDATSFSPI
jgi:hypothetical protein